MPTKYEAHNQAGICAACRGFTQIERNGIAVDKRRHYTRVSTIQGRLLHSATTSTDTYTFQTQYRGNVVVTINGAGASFIMLSK